jgi:DNA invertase Pin-like site-specific DNA recombinase
MAIIGYARVSSDGQRLEPQTDMLRAAGCTVIHEEKASGGDAKRPILRRVLAQIRAGDTLVVVRLDRLARSVTHLLSITNLLQQTGATFKSLGDPVDTTTPHGVFSLQVMAAVAEFERALLIERTKEGLRSAKARGRVGGNPGLKSRDPAAMEKLRAGRVQRKSDDDDALAVHFMPIIQQMRPGRKWDDVAAAVNAASGETAKKFTSDRLSRTVKRFVAAGKASPELLDKTGYSRGTRPRHRPLHGVMNIVAFLYLQNPQQSLNDLGRRLYEMGQKTPRGNEHWNVSSIWHALKCAREAGLIPAAKAPEAAPKRPACDLFTIAQTNL